MGVVSTWETWSDRRFTGTIVKINVNGNLLSDASDYKLCSCFDLSDNCLSIAELVNSTLSAFIFIYVGMFCNLPEIEMGRKNLQFYNNYVYSGAVLRFM